MFGRALLLGTTRAEFVAARGVFQGDGTGACNFSMSGLQAGDLMAIGVGWTASKPTVTGGGGTATWTWDFNSVVSSHFGVLWKQLSSADISAGTLTVAGGVNTQEMFAAVYRGPRSLAVRTKAASADADTTLSISGYTPASTGLGALLLLWDNGEATLPAVPSGFASRVSGGARACRALDNFDYRGAAVNVTGFGSGLRQQGFLCELIT